MHCIDINVAGLVQAALWMWSLQGLQLNMHGRLKRRTMACVYQGAEMKLTRSKFCKGPRPLGGQVATCVRLLLASCGPQATPYGCLQGMTKCLA